MRAPRVLHPLITAFGRSHAPRLLALVGALALLPGCEELEGYEGSWQGEVAADPQLRQGFAAADRLTLTITGLDGADAAMQVQLPRLPQPLPFEPIRRASADALGSMVLSGDALRSYLGFARPSDGEPYLVVVTLFSHNRVEARIIRGAEETYGVFRLRKS